MLPPLLLQPRVNAPSTPHDAAPSHAMVAAPEPAPSELSQVVCESANKTQWISTAAYMAVGAVLGVIVFVLFKRKLWGSRAVRHMVAGVAAAGAAGALVAIDPMRGDDLARCINSTEYARYILLGHAPSARIVALGVLPALVLTVLVAALVDRNY